MGINPPLLLEAPTLCESILPRLIAVHVRGSRESPAVLPSRFPTIRAWSG